MVVCVCVVCVTVGQLAGCSCWWFVLVCLSIGWLVSWLVGDGAHWSHPGVQHQQQQIGAAALPVVSTPPTCASCSCRSTSMSLLPPPSGRRLLCPCFCLLPRLLPLHGLCPGRLGLHHIQLPQATLQEVAGGSNSSSNISSSSNINRIYLRAVRWHATPTS